MTASPSRLRTLRDHIRWAVSRFHAEQLFFGHGTDNAWDEARQLVLGALHLPWEMADSYLDCRLEDDEREHLQTLLQRRIELHAEGAGNAPGTSLTARRGAEWRWVSVQKI